MSRLGERLIRSAAEALAIAEGRMKPARVVAPEEIDVAKIRKHLGLTQNGFAATYKLSPATVRDWEQKRRVPDQGSINFLRVVERYPAEVANVLAIAPSVDGPVREKRALRRSPAKR
ncbi:MAG TPA: helix-turn-helix domain-containing protein [Bauldia sp.]|nr:helix-turn-helix domain-containing protein [Bauldia sp.]